MPVIDDRGRLFGLVNLIDALVGVFLLALIPLTYGAFLLFRVPAPEIVSVEPREVVGRDGAVVQITGTDFRPFLHARVGPGEAKAFLVQSPTVAEIKLQADLAPGTYDIALFDEAQELTRKAGAVTVVKPAPARPPALPRVSLQVVGVFVGLAKDDSGNIAVGTKFAPKVDADRTPGAAATGEIDPTVAEVLALRGVEPRTERVRTGQNIFVTAPMPGQWRVPAILRLSCLPVNGECRVGDVPVAQNATLTLPLTRPRTPRDKPVPDGETPSPTIVEELRFQVVDVRSLEAAVVFPSVRTAVATIHVRFVTGPEMVDLARAGDVDIAMPGARESEHAVLSEVGGDRQSATALNQMDAAVRRNLQIQTPVALFNGTVRVPVVFTPAGWSYKDRPIKVGAPFLFESVSGAMVGWVVDMKLGPETRKFAE